MPRPIAALCSLVTVLCLGAWGLSVLAAPAQADQPAPTAARFGTKVTGKWVGTVKDDKGADGPYDVHVKIFRRGGELAGKVKYSVCSGYWTFAKKDGTRKVFIEHITQDPGIKSCVKRLKVKVKRTQNGGLYVKWVYHQRRNHMLAQKVS